MRWIMLSLVLPCACDGCYVRQSVTTWKIDDSASRSKSGNEVSLDFLDPLIWNRVTGHRRKSNV